MTYGLSISPEWQITGSLVVGRLYGFEERMEGLVHAH